MIVEGSEVQRGDEFHHRLTGDEIWTAEQPWTSEHWVFKNWTSKVIAAGRLYTNESSNLRRVKKST